MELRQLKRPVAAVALFVALFLAPCAPGAMAAPVPNPPSTAATSGGMSPSPAPTSTATPPPLPLPRGGMFSTSPIVAIFAIVSIALVGVAGVYIYGVIRKGL
jgi:hypothetical protein